MLAVGLVLDWLRAQVFKLAGRVLEHTPLPGAVNKLDACLRGEM